jgi:phage-related minor tail protein
MELFKLFGTILIDDKEALKTLYETDKKAKQASKTFDNMANMGLKIGGAVVKGLAVAGAALGGFALKGIHSADNLEKSINGLEAATGLVDNSTNKFKDTLLNIYKSNLGESFEDIADSMAVINQTVQLTGDELEKATKQALVMRDTFGFEVNESINTVNSLMANFGLTTDEAYNLMAQGAQMGANKNGDLLDIMNEYAPHFAQLGISAEEFTDTLIQGAASGAFEIDKVGDAVKEFGIRAKDGSDATAEGFEALGLNADEMFNVFSEGGPKAEQAFQTVIEKLGNMEDPLAQNQAGVALFGTMFEDLGLRGITALGNLENYTNLEVDALEQINEIKYDSFGEALAGIGRQLESGVFVPLGEKVLPKLNEFANNISINMPQIQSNIETVMIIAGNLFDGFSSAISFAMDNLNWIIPVVSGFAGAMGALTIIGTINKLIDAWKASTIIQTIAQEGLNAALRANPIGVVITIIGALIAIGVALYMNWDTIKEKALGLWDGIKTTFGNIKTFISDAMENAKTTVGNAIDKIKGFLNFNWSWPKIPLPHFSISGSVNPLKWLDEGAPRISVDWYAKGGIFSKPTIFNTPYGLKGVGDSTSPEVVAPLHKLREMLGLNKDNNNSESEIIKILNALLEAVITKDNNFYLDGQTFAKGISPYTDRVGGSNIKLAERGVIV